MDFFVCDLGLSSIEASSIVAEVRKQISPDLEGAPVIAIPSTPTPLTQLHWGWTV